MADKYLGQIVLTGNERFSIANAAFCDGSVTSISQSEALFALIGTAYGGDGVTTFRLPDLRGRTPMGAGATQNIRRPPTTLVVGQNGGVESVTLSPDQLGGHSHGWSATGAHGNSNTGAGALWGRASVSGTDAPELVYAPSSQGALIPMDSSTIGPAGQPAPDSHTNLQPFTAVCFKIVIAGVFPVRAPA